MSKNNGSAGVPVHDLTKSEHEHEQCGLDVEEHMPAEVTGTDRDAVCQPHFFPETVCPNFIRR